MKIAISSTSQNKEAEVDMNFGRCKYFQIYDTEDDQFYALRNNGAIVSDGAGVKAAQQILDENIEVIITGSLGPNAYLITKKANMMAYKAEKGSVISIIEKYKKGILPQINQAGKEHQGKNMRD